MGLVSGQNETSLIKRKLICNYLNVDVPFLELDSRWCKILWLKRPSSLNINIIKSMKIKFYNAYHFSRYSIFATHVICTGHYRVKSYSYSMATFRAGYHIRLYNLIIG